VQLTFAVTAALLLPAMAQNAPPDQSKPAKADKAKAEKTKAGPDRTNGHWGPGDRLPDKYEFGIYGGLSLIQSRLQGLGEHLHDGGAFGARVTENFWNYVGIEESYTFRENNITFLNPNQQGLPNYGFGQRLMEYGVNTLFYFRPRGSKWRPYATVGIAAFNFRPTSGAVSAAQSPAFAAFGAYSLTSILDPAMTYGAGVKYHFNDHWSFDLQGLASWSENPDFGLASTPASGSVYIPRKQPLFGLVPTAGLSYHWGQKAQWVEEKKVEAPQPLAPLVGGTLSAGEGTLCQGKAITVRSIGASDPAGRGLVYKWKVDGQPAGGNSPELSFTPDHAGTYRVELEVEAPNTDTMPVRTAMASTLSLGVQEYRAPTVSACQAVPAELSYGDSASLSASTTGSACSTTTFKWTASEGAVSPDSSPNATFDSKPVRFDQGGKIQAKTVNINGTVTDDRGASANCATAVKVNYIPPAIRFGDLIFSKGSARVNNCAKRILLDELAPKAADPDYDIVLVGHYDSDEAPKTKLQKMNALDKERTLNAIAVLTAGAGKSGKGTCANVDQTRVKADWTGDTQVDEKQPGLCGTSARTATQERRGSAVSTADENRRVEVWLVPKGTKLPAGFTAAKDLSTKEMQKEMKKLGCPK
jgi:opacity protein-like surface antigen/outer membrane protein OmpA-like peptidoglycan-associated protein